MNVKFYPLKALSLFLLFWAIGTGAYAQTMTLAKSVVNFTTGGDGSTASQGDVLVYTITVKNTSSVNFSNSKLYDNIPAGVSYKTGSTTLNGSAVADVSGAMPYANGGLINTATNGAGILAPNKTATIVFKVTVTANSGSIRNYATVDATQSGISYVNQTNTVFTNLIKDPLCNTIFQTTPSSEDGSTYQLIQDLNTSTGQSTWTYYDGSSGPCYNANTGALLASGSLLSSSAAIAYDKSTNRIYFVNNTTSKPPLGYIDLNYSTPRAYSYVGYPLETNTCPTCNINRMCFASDGYGYALTSSANDLIQFSVNSSNVPVINRMGALVNDANNPYNVLTEAGGDIFGDGSGRVYLIGNSSRIYKINTSTRVATYMGTATPTPTGPSQAIAIDPNGVVYIGGGYGNVGAGTDAMVYQIDLFTMAITAVNTPGTAGVYNAGDYASCAFPVLQSNIVASKTFKNKNGSSTVVGGDTVTYVITISNTGNFNAAGVKLYDYIPSSTHYVPNSSTLNGNSVPDVGGVMPYAVTGGSYVNSPGESPGIIKTGSSNAAVMTFDVVTDPNKTICNQSKITLLDADGNIMFVNSSDPNNPGQTPTCFYSDVALPLTDLKFKGSLSNSQQSVLNWSMTRDENITAYNVQYSDDGVTFKTIGTVAPSGSVNTLNQYQYTDVANTYSSIRYYRLELVQKGGTINYSGIVRLNVKAVDVQVLPNPFDKNLNLQFELKTSETVKVRLLDFSGREVYTLTDNYSAGSHSVSISVPAKLDKGMYVLDVIAGNEHIYQKKLIRQ
jgi:uncharacterized repeat protein (TIGR01451 family)